MALRQELVVSEPDEAYVATLRALAGTAVDVLWQAPHSSDKAAHDAVRKIQALTGDPNYDAFYFHSLMGFASIEDFARRAALGTPPSVPDLDRHEVVDVIGRIDSRDRAHSTFYLDLLMNSFPYASVSDILYYPDRERTPEETADEILHRRQLFETGGLAAVSLHILALANAVVSNPSSKPWAQQWAEGIIGSSQTRQ